MDKGSTRVNDTLSNPCPTGTHMDRDEALYCQTTPKVTDIKKKRPEKHDDLHPICTLGHTVAENDFNFNMFTAMTCGFPIR